MGIFNIEKSLNAFSVKDASVSTGEFSAYLSIFNIVDRQNDIVAPGAFKATLQELYLNKTSSGSAYLFPILYQHDANQPIGGVTSAIEDSKGLLVQGIIDVDTSIGRTVISGMKKGYLNSMSIGYRIVKSSKGVNGVRILDVIDLHEGSIVTFPAMPAAKVLAGSVKNYDYRGDKMNYYTMVDVEADKKYTVSDVAELLGVNEVLARNLIERGMRENKIHALQSGWGYWVEGSEVKRLHKAYTGDIDTNRASNGIYEKCNIDVKYPKYDTYNAKVIDSLIEGHKDDLRLDKELPDREYFEYK